MIVDNFYVWYKKTPHSVVIALPSIPPFPCWMISKFLIAIASEIGCWELKELWRIFQQLIRHIPL